MIEIKALHKYYGAVHALDGLDMTIEPGAVFGFLGPNGAGKTTTLRILAGLARPTSGSAVLSGVNPEKEVGRLSRLIGFLPEEPSFYPWMTPREFLDYLGKLHGLPAQARSARITELLEQADLGKVAKRRIGGFSRGMRQRLGLAAALLHQPAVLLLDEPVSALDPSGRKEMLDLIESLGGGCTVLMSSHILADVERVCTVVGIINQGRLVVQADREVLLEQYAQPVFQLTGLEASAMEKWAGNLKSQPWISTVTQDGIALRVAVKDVNHARRALLASAVQEDILLRHFEELRPSLEDVFLQLVEMEAVS